MESRRTAFHNERCDLCGLCLHMCPVMELPIDEAKREFKALIEGKESRYALRLCNSCMSCNLYCPWEANPYQLILERWNDLYKKRGAPPLYKFVCPTEEPNIWQLINIFLTDTEKEWIAEMAESEESSRRDEDLKASRKAADSSAPRLFLPGMWRLAPLLLYQQRYDHRYYARDDRGQKKLPVSEDGKQDKRGQGAEYRPGPH